jgi:hypothetical protein
VSGVVPPVNTRWKPGQSGNPRGRPQTFTKALYRVLRSVKDPQGRSQLAYDVMKAQVQAALDGDTNAARFVTETLQGKPTSAVEHSGAIASASVKIIIKGSDADTGWNGMDSP